MDIKKEKRPTKKGLINEIETLDKNKVFNLKSSIWATYHIIQEDL